MRVLSNLNGRVTYALPVVEPKVDFPAPTFMIASMTKYTVDFYIRGLHSAKRSGYDDNFKWPEDITYGPNEEHLYHMHARWYHGDINNEKTWERVYDLEKPKLNTKFNYTIFHECIYSGATFVTETISVKDLDKEIAKFYNSASILEQLESNAANNGLYGHDYWMCWNELHVV